MAETDADRQSDAPGPAGAAPRRPLAALLALTFLESTAMILVERGIYFYTHQRLGFGPLANLALALGFGVAYLVGATSSHAVAARVGERRLVRLAIAGALALHLLLVASPTAATVVVASVLIAACSGMKWPVVESFLAAGRTADQTAGALGRFNVCWAASIPVALALAGPLIEVHRSAMFLLAAGLNVLTLAALSPALPRRPGHDATTPPRMERRRRVRFGRLLGASRWLMLASYSAMWVLAALLPDILAARGVDGRIAPGLSALLDVARLTAFVVLWRWPGWHGRVGPLAIAAAGLPLATLAVVLAPGVAWVLAGEVAFGLCAGLIYYSDLYYGLVVRRAAVDAGGAHEGLIGSGFALGPACGLLGVALAGSLGSGPVASLPGLAPLLALCLLAAARGLARASGRS